MKVVLKKIKERVKRYFLERSFTMLYTKYTAYTMIPEKIFIGNLALLEKIRNVEGSIVECGVWRGGMSAAITEILGTDKKYFLYDSFKGLPAAREIDGVSALEWQKNTSSPSYFNNCKAEIDFARKCMAMAGAQEYELVQGWFADTLPQFSHEKIALLRLDGDWYDSTMDCLKNLFPKVTPGGLIIIDDYYAWDGCCRALHDYLSQHSIPVRIRESNYGVCYIIKN